MSDQVKNWGGKRARSGPARVQENLSVETSLQEQSINANPNSGIGVPTFDLPRVNLDTPEVPNMTSMIGLMQSMAHINEQLTQLMPTLVQSSRQTTHHNRGDADATEESKYFSAFKHWTPKYSRENSRTLS